MTEAAVKKPSIIATLLAELEAIESNFHGLAEPQLAIAGKMRELLTEAVEILDGLDGRAIATRINGALEQVRGAVAKAEDIGKKLEAGLLALEDLTKRVAALEPKATTTAATAPASAAPAAASGGPDAPAGAGTAAG